MRRVRFLVCCIFLWGMSCLLHAQMLVVCAPEYIEEMKPFVTWKIQKGIPTQMVSMSEIGETYEDLRDYVKDYYQTHHIFCWLEMQIRYRSIIFPVMT